MGASQWIAVGSVVVAALSLAVTLARSLASSEREDGKTAEVLRQVDGKLKDIRDQVGQSAALLERTVERVTRVEESAKQAPHRIDELRSEMHNSNR